MVQQDVCRALKLNDRYNFLHVGGPAIIACRECTRTLSAKTSHSSLVMKMGRILVAPWDKKTVLCGFSLSDGSAGIHRPYSCVRVPLCSKEDLARELISQSEDPQSLLRDGVLTRYIRSISSEIISHEAKVAQEEMKERKESKIASDQKSGKDEDQGRGAVVAEQTESIIAEADDWVESIIAEADAPVTKIFMSACACTRILCASLPSCFCFCLCVRGVFTTCAVSRIFL
jgi:hypothetical protein